jgi:pyridoxal phosphate enzyme (YggS family)
MDILGRILAAQKRSSRRQSVTLVGVSKKQTFEKMNAYGAIVHQAGEVPVFGENYLQEFLDKKDNLVGPYESHFIGRIQSNKIRDIVKNFSVIESVSSLKILTKIDEIARAEGIVYPVFLQVNISKDSQKSGFMADQIQSVVQQSEQLKNIKVIGLMTITENYSEPYLARDDFRAMRVLGDSVFGASSNYYLSMGMSQDFEVAIEEGATHVRIGTKLFGERI